MATSSMSFAGASTSPPAPMSQSMPHVQNLVTLTMQWDWETVLLSYLVAVIASYATVNVLQNNNHSFAFAKKKKNARKTDLKKSGNNQTIGGQKEAGGAARSAGVDVSPSRGGDRSIASQKYFEGLSDDGRLKTEGSESTASAGAGVSGSPAASSGSRGELKSFSSTGGGSSAAAQLSQIHVGAGATSATASSKGSPFTAAQRGQSNNTLRTAESGGDGGGTPLSKTAKSTELNAALVVVNDGHADEDDEDEWGYDIVSTVVSLGVSISSAFCLAVAGIWSMHFIGMEAMHMGVSVEFDPLLTVASAAAAFVCTSIAVVIVRRSIAHRESEAKAKVAAEAQRRIQRKKSKKKLRRASKARRSASAAVDSTGQPQRSYDNDDDENRNDDESSSSSSDDNDSDGNTDGFSHSDGSSGRHALDVLLATPSSGTFTASSRQGRGGAGALIGSKMSERESMGPLLLSESDSSFAHGSSAHGGGQQSGSMRSVSMSQGGSDLDRVSSVQRSDPGYSSTADRILGGGMTRGAQSSNTLKSIQTEGQTQEMNENAFTIGGRDVSIRAHINAMKEAPHGALLGAALLIATGVVAMHYTGMAAMSTVASVQPRYGVIVASVLIAATAATAALYLAFVLPLSRAFIVPTALVMGVAVCGMHYCGMYGLVFEVDTTSLDYMRAAAVPKRGHNWSIWVVAASLTYSFVLNTFLDQLAVRAHTMRLDLSLETCQMIATMLASFNTKGVRNALLVYTSDMDRSDLRLARAFYQLARNLEEYKPFLPHYLFESKESANDDSGGRSPSDHHHLGTGHSHRGPMGSRSPQMIPGGGIVPLSVEVESIGSSSARSHPNNKLGASITSLSTGGTLTPRQKATNANNANNGGSKASTVGHGLPLMSPGLPDSVSFNVGSFAVATPTHGGGSGAHHRVPGAGIPQSPMGSARSPQALPTTSFAHRLPPTSTPTGGSYVPNSLEEAARSDRASVLTSAYSMGLHRAALHHLKKCGTRGTFGIASFAAVDFSVLPSVAQICNFQAIVKEFQRPGASKSSLSRPDLKTPGGATTTQGAVPAIPLVPAIPDQGAVPRSSSGPLGVSTTPQNRSRRPSDMPLGARQHQHDVSPPRAPNANANATAADVEMLSLSEFLSRNHPAIAEELGRVSPAELQQRFTAVFSFITQLFVVAVHRIARETGGSVHSFAGDRVEVSWNTARRQHQPAAKMAQFLARVAVFCNAIERKFADSDSSSNKNNGDAARRGFPSSPGLKPQFPTAHPNHHPSQPTIESLLAMSDDDLLALHRSTGVASAGQSGSALAVAALAPNVKSASSLSSVMASIDAATLRRVAAVSSAPGGLAEVLGGIPGAAVFPEQLTPSSSPLMIAPPAVSQSTVSGLPPTIDITDDPAHHPPNNALATTQKPSVPRRMSLGAVSSSAAASHGSHGSAETTSPSTSAGLGIAIGNVFGSRAVTPNPTGPTPASTPAAATPARALDVDEMHNEYSSGATATSTPRHVLHAAADTIPADHDHGLSADAVVAAAMSVPVQQSIPAELRPSLGRAILASRYLDMVERAEQLRVPRVKIALRAVGMTGASVSMLAGDKHGRVTVVSGEWKIRQDGMARSAQAAGLPVVIDSTTAKGSAMVVESRAVDAVADFSGKHVEVFAVVKEHESDNDDEWMYILEEQERRAAVHAECPVARAVTAAVRGDVSHAAAILSDPDALTSIRPDGRYAPVSGRHVSGDDMANAVVQDLSGAARNVLRKAVAVLGTPSGHHAAYHAV